MTTTRVACALAAMGLFSSAALAADPAPWRIAHQIEGYGADALALCLVKPRRGGWAVSPVEDAGPDCVEQVMFDRASRTLYLAFPGVLALAEYQCSGRLSISGRHPCTSSFFPPQKGRPDWRRLDREMLQEALTEARAFAHVEQQFARQREQEALEHERRAVREAIAREQALREYRAAFDALATSRGTAEAEAFVNRYRRDDPDGLVPRALALLDEREKEAQAAAREQARRQYLAAFALLSPQSPTALLEDFIVRYTVQGDPERLVPRVRVMLDERLRRLQAEAALLDRRQRLEALELSIARCKRVIAESQALRRREEKIAAGSGYVQPQTLRQAVANEVDCGQIIDESYRRYRELGGSRSQVEIE
jgi:hypothetical protein